MIEKYLDDLECRIDAVVEDDLYRQWNDFAEGRIGENFFSPKRPHKNPAKIKWPDITINEALNDYEKMALQQFGLCSNELEEGSGKLLAVRCNYGTSILPSLFGAELFIMDEELNTLPSSRPLPHGSDSIKSLLDRGIPDLTTGLGSKVIEMGLRYREKVQHYPKIRKYVHIYHPDLQGPLDICEVLWGSSMFLHFYDSPILIKTFLNLIVATYIAFLKKWQQIVPPLNDIAVHWSMLHRGQIMLRDDSAMNLSPSMFDEFIKPYDQELLHEFNGGAIHFCGKGDHFIESASEMQGLYAIAMSQPEYNDMETIYQNTVDKNIQLLGLRKETAELALKKGRNLHGHVHCW